MLHITNKSLVVPDLIQSLSPRPQEQDLAIQMQSVRAGLRVPNSARKITVKISGGLFFFQGEDYEKMKSIISSGLKLMLEILIVQNIQMTGTYSSN